MSSLKRKIRRRQPKRAFVDEVFELAGWSLGFTSAEVSAAAAVDRAAPTEMGDLLEARALELLELVDRERPPEFFQERRAELEQRRGDGFVERVRAMGTPATEVIGREGGAYSIHYVNFSAVEKLGRFVLLSYRRGAGQSGWIRSSKSSGGFGRRFTSRLGSVIGCGRGRGSSGKRAKLSTSFSFGGAGVFASRPSLTVIRTSRSSETTGRSNARRGPKIDPQSMTLRG